MAQGTRQKYQSLTLQGDTILQRNFLNPHQTYAFSFNGKDRQSKALLNEINERFAALLGRHKCVSLPSQAIKEAWIEAAMACGVSDGDIRAVITEDVPDKYAYLKEVCPNSLDNDKKIALMRTVANWFDDYNTHWHIIRLHGQKSRARRVLAKNNKKEENPKHGQELNSDIILGILKEKSLYTEHLYPYDIFLKVVAGKKRKFTRPVLSEYLFVRFNNHQERLVRNAIKGFGSVVINKQSSPRKAQIVSDSEIKNFRKAVGAFEEALTKGKKIDIEFKKGDVVNVEIMGYKDSYEILAINDVNSKTGKVTLVLYCDVEGEDGKPTRQTFSITTTVDNISLYKN